MTRVVVLSDLHVAPPGELCNFTAGETLATFLESQPAATDVVFAGDTFDFLQVPNRPTHLDLVGAHDLVSDHLLAIQHQPWGARFFAAIAKICQAGGSCVFLPGNHDPELFHPAAEEALRTICGLPANMAAFSVDRSGKPLRRCVEGWEVVVGHGHRHDPFNDIDPSTVRDALGAGKPTAPLPPGSLLVLRTIDAFRRAVDPDSGQRRFPFVDALKPEMSGVALLLLYLDPRLFLSHAPGLTELAARAFVQALRARLQGGATLAVATQDVVGEDAWAELMAATLVGELSEGERAAPAAIAQRLVDFLEVGSTLPARPGMLAAKPRGLTLLRAAVSHLRATCTFFDRSMPSKHDQRIIDDWIGADVGRRVVISGHTHAARELRLSDDRIYLNTGTWTDLMTLPAVDTDDALLRWVDDLKADRVPRLQQLTYAVIDQAGPRLEQA